MSENIIDLFQVYNCETKIRLGNNFDGGYVIADNIGEYDAYISAGIGGDESFSKDFLNKYNVTNTGAFQLDIEKLPDNFPKKLNFYKRNISDISDNNNANLNFFIQNYNNIFLKMDIEGDEYKWFNSKTSEELSKFKQFAVEFHGINDDSFNYSLKIKKDVFSKLSETHFLIHAHGNNYAGTQLVNKINMPFVVELTYIRKDCLLNALLNKKILPSNLDYPNDTNNHEDINLNFYPFVNN
jgi:hypothetical protein